MTTRALQLLALASTTLTLLLAGCAPTADDASSTSSPAPVNNASAQPATTEQPAAAGSAAAALATLPIKGRAAKTGYDRDQFGQAWADEDHNGCDTRNDILARDLANLAYKAGTNNCVVTTGTLADPYTNATIAFTRGQNTSTAVQIDHVVALSNAWQTGAQQWAAATRQAFANDPLNLIAVDGPTNEAKGDGDAATWLPPNTTYRCTYVARQVAVKATYGLWVTQAEHDAIAALLATCPGQPLPDANSTASSGTPDTAVAAGAAAPAADSSPTTVKYANCDAARAAGVTPLRAGDPGYSTSLDRDNDGVACE